MHRRKIAGGNPASPLLYQEKPEFSLPSKKMSPDFGLGQADNRIRAVRQDLNVVYEG